MSGKNVGLGVLLALGLALPAQAQEWSPVSRRSASRSLDAAEPGPVQTAPARRPLLIVPTPPTSQPAQPAQPSIPIQNAVTLGRPVFSTAARAVATVPAASLGPVVRVAHTEEATPRRVVRAQAPDSAPPPAAGGSIPVPGNDLFNGGAAAPVGSSWYDKVKGFWSATIHPVGRKAFESDHSEDLDHLASPVSFPFLAEDPRSLTEIRPIFIYQTIPNDTPTFQGGDVKFFGMQARVALTEHLSIVMNKFGGVSFNPDEVSGFPSDSGFAELWIGPKYTFYRDLRTNTVAAAGLTFQIASGSDKVFQDTGNLSIAPYFSFARSFGLGNWLRDYGSMNFMSTTGYAFSTDDQRSDYFYTQLHLDFDVGGQHKLYPFLELNYLRYTGHGGASTLTVEGGDLINFGSMNLSQRNMTSLASGVRYKFCESIQIGAAAEIPLNNQSNLMDFRLTFDLILRY